MSLLRLKGLAACAAMAGVALAYAPTSRAVGDASSPYIGRESRAIKALSERETADLLAGRGMGYALAAELNHYPGPAHVLEFAEQLGLSPEQRRRTQELFGTMEREAQAIGARIVESERQLDTAFATGQLDKQIVSTRTAALGKLYGQYRATHLAAHLQMKALLTPAQIAAYDRLRGYDAPAGQPAPFKQHPSH